jgi:hypothetical protein
MFSMAWLVIFTAIAHFQSVVLAGIKLITALESRSGLPVAPVEVPGRYPWAAVRPTRGYATSPTPLRVISRNMGLGAPSAAQAICGGLR